jgi:hypothetical protein
MVNIDVAIQEENINIREFDFEDQQINMIFVRIDEYISYLDMEELYEPNRFAAAINFYQYLDETENVWKNDVELVEDIFRVSNRYLNKIWFDARQVADNEASDFVDERHIRGRLTIDLFQSINYFMDKHIDG